MYDDGERFFMLDIGRWGVVNPLEETSRRWSPYTYAYNSRAPQSLPILSR
jgi:hypothetical protein